MCTSTVKRRNCLTTLILGLVFCAMISMIFISAGPLHAAVVVFSNETTKTVTFVVGDSPKDRASHKAYKVATGDVLPVPVDESKTPQKIVWFDSRQNGQASLKGRAISNGQNAQASDRSRDIQSVTVKPNSIYTFTEAGPTGDGSLQLKHRFSVADSSLPTKTSSPSKPSQASSQASNQASPTDIGAVVPIPIMILVDDDEPRRREIWERELRARVKKASDIFERTCRVRFEIVKIGSWETDDRTIDFDKTLSEFQRKVKPDPGIALAIGFTSQYEVQTKGRFHMGGTRGLLFPYILIREWSQHVGKPERLELLVHELGHVFGATHTPDQSSVMRPVVGDNRSNAKSFRIGFDPLNTLAVYLFCEPIRLDGVRSLRQYSPESRANLMSVYGELGQRFPSDHSAAMYRAALQRSKQIRFRRPRKINRPGATGYRTSGNRAPGRFEKLLPEATRLVVRTIVLRADQLETSDSDQRFQECVKVAARAVEKLPPELATRAMMLGIGIALDASGRLRQQPGFRETYDQIVSPPQRQRDQATIGCLSIRGHANWAARFALTLGRSVLVTPGGAEASAITDWWKSADNQNVDEPNDADQTAKQKTIDLRDVVIDIAAATLASRLLSGQILPATLAERFDVNRYLPDETFFSTLPEPLDRKSLDRLYGSPSDARFLKFKASARRKACQEKSVMPE